MIKLTLIQAMRIAKPTQKIIRQKGMNEGLIWSDRFHSFLWCESDGKVCKSETDPTGYSHLVMVSSLMGDDYYIQ